MDEGSTFSFVLSFQKTKMKPELEIEMMELDAEIKILESVGCRRYGAESIVDENAVR